MGMLVPYRARLSKDIPNLGYCMKTILTLLFFISQAAWSVPESELPHAWEKDILPHFESLTFGHLKESNYFYSAHPKNKKTIVIVPGRTEPSKKYAEFIYDYRLKGVNIFIIDLPGQGTSPRLLADTQKGHIENFDDYVDSLEEFVQEVVIPQSSGTPLYLLAHSMGGAVAVKYLARQPKYFTKVVLTAPMLEVNSAPFSETIGRNLAKFLIRIGKGEHYAPTRGPHIPKLDTFALNILTKSEARFNTRKHLWDNFPELIIAGPTSSWVYESLRSTKNIQLIAKEIPVPLLIFQAGEDQVVKPARQNSFCNLAPDCKLVKFPLARHEILMEKDEDRNRALNLINEFFGL